MVRATKRRKHVGDVGVVGELARPEVDAAGAADGDGAVVLGEGRALIHKVLLHQWHVVQRVHVRVLVVGQDEDDIGPRCQHGREAGKSRGSGDVETHDGKQYEVVCTVVVN